MVLSAQNTIDWKKAPPETVVCYCNKVSKEAIVLAIAAGVNCVESIGYTTGAGTGSQCRELHPQGRCCKEDIAVLLSLYGGRCGGLCQGCGGCQ